MTSRSGPCRVGRQGSFPARKVKHGGQAQAAPLPRPRSRGDGQQVLDEIDPLNTQIASKVAAGSSQVFRPHESGPTHGDVETVHDRRAMLLSCAGYLLQLLRRRMARSIAELGDAECALNLLPKILEAPILARRLRKRD